LDDGERLGNKDNVILENDNEEVNNAVRRCSDGLVMDCAVRISFAGEKSDEAETMMRVTGGVKSEEL
jgi:hypothetical protein